MICSVAELGIGNDHAGIMVLPSGKADPVTTRTSCWAWTDTVIELYITPDRGYCFSVRGLPANSRCALDRRLPDPAAHRCRTPMARRGRCRSKTIRVPAFRRAPGHGHRSVRSHPVVDAAAADARRGPARSRWRSTSRTTSCSRLGQPMHAFDALDPWRHRRSQRNTGETLRTLDDSERMLDRRRHRHLRRVRPGFARGHDGWGEHRGARRLRPTSRSRRRPGSRPRSHAPCAGTSCRARRGRFERFVDPALPPPRSNAPPGCCAESRRRSHPPRPHGRGPSAVAGPGVHADQPARPDGGVRYAGGGPRGGCSRSAASWRSTPTTRASPIVTATPPTWRADLTQPADLVEEVLRLEGYDTIPSVLPTAPAGRGLTATQRRRRGVSRALAEAGYVEVGRSRSWTKRCGTTSGSPSDDVRRTALSVLNPLEAERDQLATTLLPGLLDTLSPQRRPRRARRRVVPRRPGHPAQGAHLPVPDVGVTERPTDAQDHGVARGAAAASRCTSRSCSPGTVSRRAGGARASRRRGPTPSRPPGWWARRPGVPSGWWRPISRRGTRAGARSCAWATGRSATRANCTRRWSRRWACRSARARWSWTWTCCRCWNTGPRRASRPTRRCCWTWRSWSTRPCRSPTSPNPALRRR